ncbi:MAG: serine hydrolase [Hyphomonadaceae bacterium]
MRDKLHSTKAIKSGLVGRREALRLLAGGGVAASLMSATSLHAWAQAARNVDPAKLLFLEGEDQVYAFRNIDKLFPTRPFTRGANVFPLPKANNELDIKFDHEGRSWTTAEFMNHNRVAGLVVASDGRIILERYGLGHDAAAKWTSFSVAKSLTSTLVGAAIKDGHIKSVLEPVTKYLPVMKGTAFDGAIIRDLLRMSGPEAWVEDYLQPNSDVNQHIAIIASRNKKGAMLEHMTRLKRAWSSGTFNEYRTGESYILGEIVAAAIGAPLSPYVTEKIWKPFGMEADGYWMLTAEGGTEWGGACFSATSRDYVRFGQFILGGGVAGGRQILPDGWIAEATEASAPGGKEGRKTSYGYQWWITEPGQAFRGVGIFGQQLHIVPPQKLVISIQSAWPKPGVPVNGALATAFVNAVRNAVA